MREIGVGMIETVVRDIDCAHASMPAWLEGSTLPAIEPARAVPGSKKRLTF